MPNNAIQFQAFLKAIHDFYDQMIEEAKMYQPRSRPPQAAMTGHDEMFDEDDKDREYRLMRKYTMGETLTPEEFDFLRRRGCVRY